MPRNPWLVAGGVLSAAAAILHLAVIAGGPDWYRFFGAGEGMARMAERGMLQPTLITLGIVAILAVWAAYAFAGAGLIRRLPLMRTALVAISAVYLLRGLVLAPMLAFRPERVDAFTVWSSLIVLVYGILYAVGTMASLACIVRCASMTEPYRLVFRTHRRPRGDRARAARRARAGAGRGAGPPRGDRAQLSSTPIIAPASIR